MGSKGIKTRQTKNTTYKVTLKGFLNLFNDDVRIIIDNWEVSSHFNGDKKFILNHDEFKKIENTLINDYIIKSYKDFKSVKDFTLLTVVKIEKMKKAE